jgi:drug/metabolite transporter (DMT)-like permease
VGGAELVLVLLSTCLHAGWNLLGKSRAPSLAFFTMAMGSGGLIFSPLLLAEPYLSELTVTFWAWLALSGLLQTLYMGGLAWGYATGEMSVLYPLARALPVLIVSVISVGLLGGELSRIAVAGIATILTGATCLVISNSRSVLPARGRTAGLAFALLAALATSAYTVVDKLALNKMLTLGYSEMSAGFSFMVLQALATPFWAIPLILCMPKERKEFRNLPAEWRLVVVTGLMITGTYGLVLIAMAVTAEISLVIALRQLSIPLGVMAGIMILKERADMTKLLGTITMLIGLVLVSVA